MSAPKENRDSPYYDPQQNPRGYEPADNPHPIGAGNHQCWSKSKRTGKQCGRPAMHGKNVCMHHGGKSVAGKDSGSFKHGRYSKALKSDPIVQGFYEEESLDPDVTSLDDETRLLRAMLKSQISEGAGTPELIHDYALAISRLAERAHKIRHGEQVTITALDYETALTAIFRLVADVYGVSDAHWGQFVLRAQGLLKAAAAKATRRALEAPSEEPDEYEIVEGKAVEHVEDEIAERADPLANYPVDPVAGF